MASIDVENADICKESGVCPGRWLSQGKSRQIDKTKLIINNSNNILIVIIIYVKIHLIFT